MKCPGQDTRYWKPGDIYEVKCPGCGAAIEFFKDEVRRRCKSCGTMVPNPRLDLSCVEWCRFADRCVGPEKAREMREKKKK